MDTAVTRRHKPDLPAPIQQGLVGLMPNAYKLLPPDVEPERFRAAVWLHLQRSPRLLECQPETILECCVRAASDGLLPGIECYFVPFKGKASYVRHYQGLIKLLERTGKLHKAFAHPVYEGDTFHADYFAERPQHVPYMVRGTDPGALRFYYGALLTADGTWHFRLAPTDYIESVRRRAPGGEQEAWRNHPVEMACKTALKYAAKFVQLTPKIAAVLQEEDDAPPAPPTDAQHQQTVAELWGQRGHQEETVVLPATPQRPVLWEGSVVLPEPSPHNPPVAHQDGQEGTFSLEADSRDAELPLEHPEPSSGPSLEELLTQALTLVARAEKAMQPGDMLAPHILDLQRALPEARRVLAEGTAGKPGAMAHMAQQLADFLAAGEVKP